MRPSKIAIPCLALVLFLAIGSQLISAPTTKKEPDKEEGPPTKEQYRDSLDKIKMLGLSFHNYEGVHGKLPNNVYSKDGKALLSWRVNVLPYLEEEALYKQFKLDEPWDSPNNKKLVEKIPGCFTPVRGKAPKGSTFYQMFSGPNTFLGEKGKAVNLATIPDGTSNTLMIAEAHDPVIWTKPDDIPFDGKTRPKLGRPFGGEFHGVMGDGSGYLFKKDLSEMFIVNVITTNDGNVINLNEAIKE